MSMASGNVGICPSSSAKTLASSLRSAVVAAPSSCSCMWMSPNGHPLNAAPAQNALLIRRWKRTTMAAAHVTSSVTARRRDEVYVAAMPLRGSKGPPQFLLSAAFSLGVWDLQHFVVIVKPPSSSPPPHSQAVVFDFQPKDPENIHVALAALSGKPVAGVILERKISKVPRNRCWLVGSSIDNALQDAHMFNCTWQTELRIGRHDCRDYVNGLAELLTGEKRILEQLRHISNNTS